jgi:nucleoid-associated protein YgaU
MSTAALATDALATTEVKQSPEADPRRRPRPRIAGTTTDRMPVRACSGEELGRHVQVRAVGEAERRGTSVRRQPVAEIEPSALLLTRRGKMLLTTISVLVFGAAIAVLGLRVAGVLDPEPQFSRTVQVQVGAGQSLWSIAQETNPTQNPATVVEQIANLNNLRTPADITPGQTLQIPVR